MDQSLGMKAAFVDQSLGMRLHLWGMKAAFVDQSLGMKAACDVFKTANAFWL